MYCKTCKQVSSFVSVQTEKYRVCDDQNNITIEGQDKTVFYICKNCSSVVNCKTLLKQFLNLINQEKLANPFTNNKIY